VILAAWSRRDTPWVSRRLLLLCSRFEDGLPRTSAVVRPPPFTLAAALPTKDRGAYLVGT
jgi:hypothetical protein